MNRKEFLTEFLGALGAARVVFKLEKDDAISGTVIYKPNDPEECQDFCWHASESDVPSAPVCRLAALINRRHLLSIDNLTVTREQLRNIYNKEESTELTPAEFGDVLDKLEDLSVSMVDEVEETDRYFIHDCRKRKAGAGESQQQTGGYSRSARNPQFGRSTKR